MTNIYKEVKFNENILTGLVKTNNKIIFKPQIDIRK